VRAVEQNRVEKISMPRSKLRRNLRYLRYQNSISNKMIAFQIDSGGIERLYCMVTRLDLIDTDISERSKSSKANIPSSIS